jgi:hypothetical protein
VYEKLSAEEVHGHHDSEQEMESFLKAGFSVLELNHQLFVALIIS